MLTKTQNNSGKKQIIRVFFVFPFLFILLFFIVNLSYFNDKIKVWLITSRRCKSRKYKFHFYTALSFMYILYIFLLGVGCIRRLYFKLLEQELLTLPEHMSSPPVFSGVHVTQSSVYMYVVCPFVLFLLAIMLSVLLWYTDSDYPFGIFKLFLYMTKLIA
jgi:hypothetical protein